MFLHTQRNRVAEVGCGSRREQRRRQGLQAQRRIGLESLEARALLAGDFFSVGEGGETSWTAAVESGRVRPVNPATGDQLTQSAHDYYSSQPLAFEFNGSRIVPDVPVTLGGEVHRSLVMGWQSQDDVIGTSVAAWQYDYAEPADLTRGLLHFSVGIPPAANIVGPRNVSTADDISVELIDKAGNSRGWFLPEPPANWSEYRLLLNRADSQGDFKFVGSPEFDITTVVAIRMDENAIEGFDPLPLNDILPSNEPHWNAWNHLRVEPIHAGSVHGMKFHDLNADGHRGADEPGLAGFHIQLTGFDFNGDYVERNVRSMEDDPLTRIDETGLYWIDNLPAGRYTVREILIQPAIFPPLWTQSAPPGGEYQIALSPGESIDGLDFGNFQHASIHGRKYHDLNGNGRYESHEPGLAGIQIVAVGADGVAHSTVTMEDDPHTDFDEGGLYWIQALRPGAYVVFEILVTPWDQSEPADGHYEIRLQSGEARHDLNFGNFLPGAVHGRKFHDRNANGRQDEAETGLAGWTIVLVGEDGQGNRVEQVTTTMADDPHTDFDEGGLYWFHVNPGRYEIRERLQPGWRQSAPESGVHEVRVHSRQSIDGLDFGNYQPVSIHGRKFLDLNTIGQYDPWEPGLAGWKIVLEGVDGMGQPVRQVTETMRDNPVTDFDESGFYWFSELKPGRYQITEVLRSGWRQTDPEHGHRVSLLSGEGADGLNFLNQSPLRCDLNGDEEVDAADMGIMFANWGENSGLGNLNGDHWVDAADAGICFAEWTGNRPRPLARAAASDPMPSIMNAMVTDIARTKRRR